MCGGISSTPRSLDVRFENAVYTSRNDGRIPRASSDCSSNFQIM